MIRNLCRVMAARKSKVSGSVIRSDNDAGLRVLVMANERRLMLKTVRLERNIYRLTFDEVSLFIDAIQPVGCQRRDLRVTNDM